MPAGAVGGARLLPGFVELPHGTRFCVRWEPALPGARGTVLVLPPFAEEMNRSRRTLAASGRLLAQHGFRVLLPDLVGCGDSPGEFGEATWYQWQEDVSGWIRWVALQWQQEVTVLAVRAGALLLPGAGSAAGRTILWQPVSDGRSHLMQWLRGRVASDRFSGRDPSGSIDALMTALSAGEPVETAGYAWRPDLALPMANISLADWRPRTAQRLLWVELGSGQALSVPGQALLARCAPGQVSAVQVGGNAFWQAQETTENLAFAAQTLRWLDEVAA